MKERQHNVVVRVDHEELAKLHALADDRDVPIAILVRTWVRDTYTARFGASPPPEPKLKHSKK